MSAVIGAIPLWAWCLITGVGVTGAIGTYSPEIWRWIRRKKKPLRGTELKIALLREQIRHNRMMDRYDHERYHDKDA